jgi:hypothetical protein
LGANFTWKDIRISHVLKLQQHLAKGYVLRGQGQTLIGLFRVVISGFPVNREFTAILLGLANVRVGLIGDRLERNTTGQRFMLGDAEP